jgi:hypothetical protein
MPIVKVLTSGTPRDGAGNAIYGAPVIPSTFTATLVIGTRASLYETTTARHVFVADAPCQVVAVSERHSVVGSTTGMLVKATGSTPLGSAENVLASTISHFSAVDVANYGTVLNSTTLTKLAKGDALGWRWGTPDNLPPVGGVTVTLQRI